MTNNLLSPLPTEILNEILLFIKNGNNLNMNEIRFSERTSTLLKFSKTCKELYKKLLLSNKIILLNCKFSLKLNKTIRDFFIDDKNDKIKIKTPNYLILNLDLSFNNKINDKDFKLICVQLKDKNFQLKKLYINHCDQNLITNQSIQYIYENYKNNLIEFEMKNCFQKTLTSEITEKYLFKFLKIENLNLLGCDNLFESNKNYEIFNLNLIKKLNFFLLF
jgi:hypothetical protein